MICADSSFGPEKTAEDIVEFVKSKITSLEVSPQLKIANEQQ